VEFNSDICSTKINTICNHCGILPGNFLTYLEDLNITLGMPLTLKEAGIDYPDFEKLSQLAIVDVCHQLNPQQVTKDDFYRIYEKASI